MQKEILFNNRIVFLKINQNLRPAWLAEDEEIPIFLRQAWRLEDVSDALASFRYQGQDYPACLKTASGIKFAFDYERAIDDIRQEAYLPNRRPLSSRLPGSYRLAPAKFRIALAKLLYQAQKARRPENKFPQWPIDKSLEALSYLKNLSNRIARISLWPENKIYSFVATHDLETKEGFKDLELLLKISRDFSVRPGVNVVTKLIEADPDRIEKIRKDGCTIGCHGYNHDNKIAFLSEQKLKGRLEKCAAYFPRYQIKGFRSPSLMRNLKLLAELKNYFLFDSSYPDTDWFSETATPNGCGSIRPFYINGILELPITLPMDCSLLFMGYNHEQMLKIWLNKLEWIKQRGGMALINIHCHRPFSLGTRVYQAYAKLLEVVTQDQQCWLATPEEIATHWQGIRRQR
ncbi:polysaccharide deacetylase family protein [Candidatus Omnitrophota bacterium]